MVFERFRPEMKIFEREKVLLRPLLDSSRLIIGIEHDGVSSLEMKKKKKKIRVEKRAADAELSSIVAN